MQCCPKSGTASSTDAGTSAFSPGLTILTVTASSPQPGVLVARLCGELDLASAPELDDRVRNELYRVTPQRLVLDLARLQFLGLQGIAVFERLRHACASINAKMCLVALPRAGIRALQFAGVLGNYTIHPDLPTALTAEHEDTAAAATPCTTI